MRVYSGDVKAAEEWAGVKETRSSELKPGFLMLSQGSHWVPGRKYDGILLHHFQDVSGEEPLVYNHFINVLGKPIVRHDQVTCRVKVSFSGHMEQAIVMGELTVLQQVDKLRGA